MAAAALAFQGAPASADPFSIWRSPAPAFALPTLDRDVIRLTDGAAKITLVHFFATWCEPCRDELPALQRFAARAGAEARVLVISVAEPDSRVRRFFEKAPVAFPILLDRDRSVARAWGVTTLPTTIALDARMRARLAHEAPAEWDEIEPAALLRTLAQSE